MAEGHFADTKLSYPRLITAKSDRMGKVMTKLQGAESSETRDDMSRQLLEAINAMNVWAITSKGMAWRKVFAPAHYAVLLKKMGQHLEGTLEGVPSIAQAESNFMKIMQLLAYTSDKHISANMLTTAIHNLANRMAQGGGNIEIYEEAAKLCARLCPQIGAQHFDALLSVPEGLRRVRVAEILLEHAPPELLAPRPERKKSHLGNNPGAWKAFIEKEVKDRSSQRYDNDDVLLTVARVQSIFNSGIPHKDMLECVRDVLKVDNPHNEKGELQLPRHYTKAILSRLKELSYDEKEQGEAARYIQWNTMRFQVAEMVGKQVIQIPQAIAEKFLPETSRSYPPPLRGQSGNSGGMAR
jgi:hypothetical protein